MFSTVKPINAPKPLSMLQPEPAKPVSAYDVIGNRILPVIRGIQSRDNPVKPGSLILDSDGQPIGVALESPDAEGRLLGATRGTFLSGSGVVSGYKDFWNMGCAGSGTISIRYPT